MNESSSHHLRYLLLLASGALCISFAPIFVKMVGRESLGPTAIAFWRTLFGAAILFIWAGFRKDKLLPPSQTLKYAALAGLVFFGDLFVWHRSILYSGAGMATILGNTQVFWMALIGFMVFKERLSAIFIVAVIAAFAGVMLLVGVGSQVAFSTSYTKGVVYGLATGVFYSCYITSLKKGGTTGEGVSFIVLMAWTSLFSSAFLGTAMLLEPSPWWPPDAYTWVVLASLGLVAQAVGWRMISNALSHLPVSQSSVVLLLQPTMAAVWGAIFFGEFLTWLQLFGAIITLGSIYVGSVLIGRSSAFAKAKIKAAG